jgi:hypothetical protein
MRPGGGHNQRVRVELDSNEIRMAERAGDAAHLGVIGRSRAKHALLPASLSCLVSPPLRSERTAGARWLESRAQTARRFGLRTRVLRRISGLWPVGGVLEGWER